MTATESARTRPQLTDTIAKLNGVIDGLSEAVPAVVADTLTQALGADFAAAVGRAVAAALVPAVRDLVNAEVAAAAANWGTAPVAPDRPVSKTTARPTLAARVWAGWARLSGWAARLWHTTTAWAGRQWDTLTGVATIAWAILKLMATAVAHSPAAVASAGLAALAFGGLAAVADPAVAVALTTLFGGTLAGTAAAAAPLARALTFAPDRDAA